MGNGLRTLRTLLKRSNPHHVQPSKSTVIGVCSDPQSHSLLEGESYTVDYELSQPRDPQQGV